MAFTPQNLDPRPRDRRPLPDGEVGHPPAAAPRPGPGRLGDARGDGGDRPSILDLTPGPGARHVLLLHDVQARAGRAAVVSVCTNVSCLVNGGPELLDARSRTGYVDDDDVFVEEVECIAACDLAPVLQVNYEYHGPVDAEAAIDLDRRVQVAASGRRARSRARHGVEHAAGGALMPETRIVTKFLRDHPDDSWTIDATRRTTAAYDALTQGARDGRPRRSIDGGEDVGSAGPGRRRVRHRPEVVVPAQGRIPALPRRERRRGRAVHLQGPHARRARPAPADRGRDHHRVRDPVPSRVHLHPRRVRTRRRAAEARDRRGVRRTGSSAANILGSGFDLDVILHRGAGCYIAGDETGLLSSLEGERAMPRIKPPFPAVAGTLRQADGGQQRRDAVDRPAHHRAAAASGTPGSGSNRSTGTRIFSVSGHVERPGNYEVELGIDVPRAHRGPRRRRARRQQHEVLHPGRRVVAVADARASRRAHSTWTTSRTTSRPCSGRERSWCSTRPPTRCSSRGGWRSSSRTSRAASARRVAKGSGWIEKVLYRMSNGLGRPDDLDLMLDFGDNIVPGLNAPFAQTTICALGPSVDVATSSASIATSATRSRERMGADTEDPHPGRRPGRRRPMTDQPMSQWPSDHGVRDPRRARSRRRARHHRRHARSRSRAASCSSRRPRSTAPTSRASAGTTA